MGRLARAAAKLALSVALAAGLGGGASAQVNGPVPNPPVDANQTSRLIFDAMMAVAKTAATNPAAAQSAALSYTQAVQNYNAGDLNRARAAAIQALLSANQPLPAQFTTIAPFTPMTAYQTQPFPLAGGSIAQIDADAFVAQARGAVDACVQAHSPNAGAAQQRLAAAQREDKAGRYQDVRVDAKAAVDLCAAARAGNR